MLHAVILAGGSGTRFWPESRDRHPKQFLTLLGERSLLQQAVDRCQPDIPPERIWIATSHKYVAETARQLPEISPDRILAEPCARNTAPCIGLAAQHLYHADPEALLLVTPADHVIRPTEKFLATVRQGAARIQQSPETSILIGIPPTFPATGFGYIERGEPLPVDPSPGWSVKSFREKPDRATAEQFLAAGNYFWNSGIFMWQARSLLNLMAQYQPEIHRRLQSLSPLMGTAGYAAALAEHFPRMPSISIDYGVLEQAPHAVVLPATFEWDDVGSWLSLVRLLGTDAEGNTISAVHRGLETRDCVIRSEEKHLIATIGVEGLVIVHTPEATLVARKEDETGLRRLIELLKERGDVQYL